MRLPRRIVFEVEATPLSWREGNVVFWQRLEERIATQAKRHQLMKVFEGFDMLAKKYRKNFIDIHELDSVMCHWNGDSMSSEKALLELKKMWDDCIAFLVSLQRKYHCTEFKYEKHSRGPRRGFRYTDLVAAHIEMATDAHYSAMDTPLEQQRSCTILKEYVFTWMTEQANLYVDNIEMIVRSMQRRNSALDADDIRDAWWTMILKGVLWKYSVQPHCPPGYAPIPSHFFGSKFPIYLT